MSDDALSPDALAAGLVALKELLFFGEQEKACKSEKRVYMLGVDEQLKKMTVVRPACGLWSCPECAKVLAKRWIIRTILMVEQADDPQAFDLVTLTLHENLKTHQATVDVFKDAWRKLYAHMKRACPQFSYVLVPEIHKDGRLHVHIVTNFKPPDSYCIKRKKKANKQVRRMRNPELMDKFWKDVPRTHGFGFANDQEHLAGDTVKVAGYVSKYLAKQRKVNNWQKDFKHIRASHDVPEAPVNPSELDGMLWAMQPTLDQLQAAIHAAKLQGYRMFNPSTGELLR